MSRAPARRDVAVVVLTMNQRDKTVRCIESLRRVRGEVPGIVLWDNGSTDGTAAAVREACPDVVVHAHPDNAGCARGRNLGARLACERFDPRFLMFLDNDTIVDAGLAEELRRPFDGDDRLAQTTPKIMQYGRPGLLYGARGCNIRFWLAKTSHRGYGEIDSGQYDEPGPCVPSGGCMLVRRDAFESVGGFDEIFNPYGPEDLDLGLRLAREGWRALYVPTAVIEHDPTPGKTFEGGQYTQRWASNRARQWFIFMNRHATLPQKAAFWCVGAPWTMLRLAWREARRGNLVTAIRGLVAGAASSRRPA